MTVLSSVAPFVVAPTQLISARLSHPRQWVVTLMQPVTSRSGVNPWISTFDGAAYPPVGVNIFTAPVLPVGTPMLVALRWGAGGCAFETLFNYPAGGGTFGVVADTLDLNVGFHGAALSYGDLLDVPVLGAFMVEGTAADPTPLRWRELGDPGLAGLVVIANGSDAFWAVKPYARRLRIITADQLTRYRVDWLDTASGLIVAHRFDIPAGETGNQAGVSLVVPATATVVRIVNNGAAPAAYALEWEIGLV